MAGKAYRKLKFLDGTKCLKKAGREWRTSPVQVARQHQEPQKTNEISANWNLHHDNAPSHTCFVVTEYLTKNGIVTIPQPPYSPDLAPADFFLFP
jgi:transposase